MLDMVLSDFNNIKGSKLPKTPDLFGLQYSLPNTLTKVLLFSHMGNRLF